MARHVEISLAGESKPLQRARLGLGEVPLLAKRRASAHTEQRDNLVVAVLMSDER